MKIGIVSDTHLTGAGRPLPEKLLAGLAGADLILHAGDWVSLRVAKELEAVAPVDGVAGNNDGPDIVSRFGRQKLLRLADVTVGLIHGDGYAKTTVERAYDAFAGEMADVIIFGHSHAPYMEQRGGVLLFNPGSPTDKRRQKQFSFGMMEITGRRVQASHTFFTS